jgi:hypothetical protein
MKNPLVLQICIQLANYLEGRSTLRSFRDWLAPVAWKIEASKNPAAIDLAYMIDGILMESTSGNWMESDLKKELTTAIRPFEGNTVPMLIGTTRFPSQSAGSNNSSHDLTRAVA